mgnify:FL=1|tara:strand:+ start:2792 stop:5464 length:2673 start_codon:yes stop_codon:yes gene_type:complete
MVFAFGFLEGLAESTDKGLQKGFERIREEIDSTAETQVKREEKAIDAVNKDTQEVMAKLRSAQAVLGGANDPKSAGRAAALLEQVGNVEDFDALIANIKQYKLNNEETYDFTKYFDSQQDIAGVNLAEVAQNYALGLRPPLAEIGEVERRGGGIGELFGVNVADRSRAKADAQLASLGLTMPKITEVALPSIAFKSEALKLDKMNPDQELTYLKEKLLDPDTDEGQLAFYQTRMTEISDKMGLDGKINNLTFQINMATADEKPALLKQLQTLNQEKASFDVLSTGNKVDIAKFELSEALANGDTAAANAARDKLVDMGEMSLKDVLEARISQVQIDISRVDTDSTAGMSAQADLQRELEELATLSQNIDTALQSIKPVSPPTPAGIKAVMSNVSTIVNREILDNPEFKGLNLTVRADGSIDFPEGMDENTIQKVNEFRAKREKAYLASMASAMPKDGDVAFVANMLAQGYNTSDMDALGASSDTVAAGTGQQDTDQEGEETAADETAVDEQVTGIIVPESIQNRPDLTESEKIMVAGVQSDYGSDLTESRLFDFMSDLHDDNAALLSSKGVETLIKDSVEAIYGPEVAEQYAQQIKDYSEGYAGFDNAAFNDYQDKPDTLEGQIVTVIRELEQSDPSFSVEQIAPIVKRRFYEGDRSVDIPGIMGTVTKLITKHRATRPSEQGTITPKRQKKIDQVREATGQEPPRYSPEVVPPQDDTDEDVQVDTGESFEDKMKRLNPDAIYTQDPVAGLLSGSATFPPSEKQIPYRRIGDEFFRINDDGSLDRTPAGPLVTRELLDKLGPSGDLRPDEADESQDTTVKPEAKPLETEPSDASKVKGMTTVALASKFALGTMSADEAAELERRINNDPSGNVAVQVDEIAKRVQQQRES